MCSSATSSTRRSCARSRSSARKSSRSWRRTRRPRPDVSLHEDIAQAFSLHGRVAVVTGAASGIGRQARVVLARAGAVLVVADVDETGLDTTVALVRDAGAEVTAAPTDVTDKAQVD